MTSSTYVQVGTRTSPKYSLYAYVIVMVTHIPFSDYIFSYGMIYLMHIPLYL